MSEDKNFEVVVSFKEFRKIQVQAESVDEVKKIVSNKMDDDDWDDFEYHIDHGEKIESIKEI